MKKILAFLSISIVFFTTNAQDSRFILGVEAAVIRTHPWGEEISDVVDPLYSFSPGINLEYLLSPKLSIKTGLLYERKGFSAETIAYDTSGTPIVTRDITTNLDYLTLPVLLSYSTKGTIRFYIDGGVNFGLLLSHKIILGPYEEYSEETIDASDYVRKFDFGLSFGCGINIPVRDRIAIDLGLRDNLGLLDIFKTENQGKARYNTLGLVVSLKYRL